MTTPKSQAHQALSDLPNWSVDDWLTYGVGRHGSPPPDWLELCRLAPQVLGPEPLRCLPDASAALTRIYASLAWDDPPHEGPELLALRAARAVIAGQILAPGGTQSQGLDLAIDLTDAATAPDPMLARLRSQWVQQASAEHDSRNPADRWQAPASPPNWPRPVELPVLFYAATTGEQGRLGHVRLHLVQEPGAHLRLVPAPASALLTLTASFAGALANVTAWLRRTLNVGDAHAAVAAGRLPPLQDTAIAWDLCLKDTDVPLHLLAGDSAGAAFAVGAAKLLEEAAPDAWRRSLRVLQRAGLMRTAITAALQPGGVLAHVGGARAKAEALAPLARAMQCSGQGRPRMHVAKGQPVGRSISQADEEWPELIEHASLLHLVQSLAAEAAPEEACQRTLRQALLQPTPQAPPALLRQVAQAPCRSLAHHALRTWARLERAGQVQSRFVPLSVEEADARSPTGLPEQPLRFTRLDGEDGLLTRFDSTGLHDAYLLVGAPGAGKTTLLHNHLQRLALQALQAWEQGQQPAELPLLVPLAALPEAEADPVAWLRRSLRADGAPAALLDLLDAPPGRGPALRWLLDGLNELPMADPQRRPQRAAQVVQAFRRHQARGLPLLLTARPHHVGDLPGLHLLHVNVLPWTDDDIRQYLQQRYPSANPIAADAPWRRPWAALRDHDKARELAGTPLNLAALADLLDAGFDRPPSDRASLFAGWLWFRLRREFDLVPGHPPRRPGAQPGSDVAAAPSIDDDSDWGCRRLLSDEDRQAIRHPSAWRNRRLHQPPLVGELVRSLQRQAESQWWADLDAGRRHHDLAGVQVPWSKTALWLQDSDFPPTDPRHDALRQRWGRAVVALGVAEIDEVADSFRFSHQAWGEWLASCRLLPGEPPTQADAPTAQLQRLDRALLRLRWPGPGTRRDAQELAHQLQHASAAWQAVPVGLWAGLARAELSVPSEEVFRFVMKSAGSLQEDAHRTAFFDRVGFVFAGDRPRAVEDRRSGTMRFNLQRWGDAQVGDLYGDRWERQPAAWQWLVHQSLWTPVERACWRWMHDWRGPEGQSLGRDLLQELQAQPGGLALPPPGELDEVLALSLQASPRLEGWLTWLVAKGHWQPLRPVLAWLRQQLETDAAGQTLTWRHNRPVLQQLRRLLLLNLSDAGRAAHRPLRRAGVLMLIDAPIPDLPPTLAAAWPVQRAAAFRGKGHDLRERWLAGQMLGTLGDTLRYQWASNSRPQPGPSRQGLILHPALWAHLGKRGGPPVRVRFGSGRSGYADERPTWRGHVPPLDAARYPVTVAEWRCFAEQGQGYADPDAPWWRAAGSAAQAWLRQRPGHRPPGLRDERFNNPLQPMVGITLFEALAYAAWADALVAPASVNQAAARPSQGDWCLQVPTELQWEAAVRGASSWWQALGRRWPHGGGWRLLWPLWKPSPLDFNHQATRCNGTTPVGLFPASTSATGLFDAAGNVWEWCCNALPDALLAQGWRSLTARMAARRAAHPGPLDVHAGGRGEGDTRVALRGGGCLYTADSCRVAYRVLQPPEFANLDLGVRLVRGVLPHSEH